MPKKPKAKKKRGIVVRAERGQGGYVYDPTRLYLYDGRDRQVGEMSYDDHFRLHCAALKPGESVKVRVVIESV